jgi:alpha-beta hydrolase superfamily lysophospholipase
VRLARRYNLRLTQLVSSIILVVLFGGYGSAKSVLDRFITVDDLRVHYIEVGNGPTVVMIHGNAGSVADFNFGAVDLLSSCYRVVAVDRPGHGRSDRGSTRASVEAQAELLHDVVSSLGADKPSLVGHQSDHPYVS